KTGVTAAAGAIKDGVTKAFSGLADVIKAPLRALGGFLAGIPTEVFGFQIPGADTLNNWGKSLQGFATGGGIRGPGTGTSDSIPAWLSNGEHVLTAADVKAMGGQAAVYAFRNALHRKGGGSIFRTGAVPWMPEPIGPV